MFIDREICTRVLGSATIAGSLPTSHYSDQTPPVGERDQAERKQVGVLAENVSGV